MTSIVNEVEWASGSEHQSEGKIAEKGPFCNQSICYVVPPVDYILVEWKEGGQHSVVPTKLAESTDFSVGSYVLCKLPGEGEFEARILTAG